VVIGGALALAVLPRLLQPAILVLAHRNDTRYKLGAWPKRAEASP